MRPAHKSMMPALLVWEAHLESTALASIREGCPSLPSGQGEVLLVWARGSGWDMVGYPGDSCLLQVTCRSWVSLLHLGETLPWGSLDTDSIGELLWEVSLGGCS